jgi:hypothetical protein
MIMSTWRRSSFSGNCGNCVEIGWRKSTFSANGSACVEVGWRKGSFGSNDGDCVAVGWPGVAVAVRDSKHAPGPSIEFPVRGWRAFVANLQR